ncbi:MAG: hypothetical protein IJV94_04675 [Bacilli bacterium]|nr:hypothetical protein [Bacilli bacterium]
MENNLMDKILDMDDESSIVLFNEKGEEIAFEKICLVPLEDELYIILKPVQTLEGVGEDEGLVFKVDDEKLVFCDDFKIIDKVFDIYFDLLKKETN